VTGAANRDHGRAWAFVELASLLVSKSNVIVFAEHDPRGDA